MIRFGISNHVILPIAVCLLALTGCSKLEKCSIDIPEGYATQTLKEFAKQADIEIVFNAPSVADVRTNAVSGRMTPIAALDLMLSGTNLVFERDSETGAYAVIAIDKSDTAASVNSRLQKNNLIGKQILFGTGKYLEACRRPRRVGDFVLKIFNLKFSILNTPLPFRQATKSRACPGGIY